MDWLPDHSLSLEEAKAGTTWRRELVQRPWRALLSVLPMAGSACFLIEPRTTSLPRGGAAHSGLGPPHINH